MASLEGDVVCTADFSGTANVTIFLPDFGREVVVPIRVKGRQLAAMTFKCKESGVVSPVGETVTNPSLATRVSEVAHCQFDYVALRDRAVSFAQTQPTGYGMTVELKKMIVNEGNNPVLNRWLCIDGVYSNGCGLDEGEPAHAHLRFAGFSSTSGAIGRTRPVLTSAFPDAETENRFKGVMEGNGIKYLIITNNNARTYSPYAPTLFKQPRAGQPPTTPVSDGFYSFDPARGGVYLKAEFGVPAPASNFQFDFEAFGRGLSPPTHLLSHKSLVDNVSTPKYTLGTDLISITIRAYAND